MARLTTRVPSLWMAGFGIVSGVASDLSLSLPVPDLLERVGAPVYPGLLFGLAVAAGVYLFAGASWARALFVLVFTALAWVAAFRGCAAIYEALAADWLAAQGMTPPLATDGSIDSTEALRLKDALKSNLIPLLASLMAAGAIGAGGTALGAALAVPALRHPIAWLSTTSIGALCALGLFVGDALIGSPPGLEFTGLFVIWQALVAATIGYGLRFGDRA